MQDVVSEEYTLEIAPSPGTEERDWAGIEKKLELMKGKVTTIHVDVVDGRFAPNTTLLDPKPYAKYAQDFVLEVHLMVENPIQYLKPFADAGFKRFIGHIEKMPNISEFVALGQTLGEVGLGIDAPTPITVLDTLNLDDLDCILIMTVQAGFSGQAFMESELEKVKKIHEKSMIPIEVDGGIKDTNILFAKQAGAVRFVATSFVWQSNDWVKAVERLQNIIKPE